FFHKEIDFKHQSFYELHFVEPIKMTIYFSILFNNYFVLHKKVCFLCNGLYKIKKMRLEDAISVNPYIRSEAEDVRGGENEALVRLEDAT
ncbi:MAG: hypothetical protein IJL84_00685, partial [Paludibacteraceae bacterium]|nr:hypothetical protein [Paludibacteraceae bacterium]